jgi:hypothetical protein
MNAYGVRVVSNDVVVDLIDDDQTIRNVVHGFLGGAKYEFNLGWTATDADERREQCADGIIGALATGASNAERYLIVDNYLPWANVGREVAQKLCEAWIVVITDSGNFDEHDISNPRYLGWLPKDSLPKLSEALGEVLNSRADHLWLRERLLQAKNQGRAVTIRNLKHKIVNLLKPTLIDLESVQTLWASSGDSMALGELKEVVARHATEPNYYGTLLEELRNLTVGSLGVEAGTAQAIKNLRDPTLDIGVANRACLLGVGFSDSFEMNADWLGLCNLLGIQRCDSGYVTIEESSISRFCQKMDDIKDLGDDLCDGMSPIMAFFFQGLWDRCDSRDVVGFPGWFSSLCDRLDSIQGQFQQERDGNENRNISKA